MSEPPLALKPRPGFDWAKVVWGKGTDRPSEICCYCAKPIPDAVVPLILWKENGGSCRFCDGCMHCWWGFELDRERAE